MEWRSPSEIPEPDPWFVRELKLIDPTMRVMWAQERYLRQEWAIERLYPAERYWLSHESLLQDGGDRFVEQKVYDDSQPLYDDAGNHIGSKVIGIRKFDLAPEYEWIAFRPTLDQALLTLIKKLIWKNAHPEEVAAERRGEQDSKETATERKVNDAIKDGVDEAFRESRKVVQFGRGAKRNE